MIRVSQRSCCVVDLNMTSVRRTLPYQSIVDLVGVNVKAWRPWTDKWLSLVEQTFSSRTKLKDHQVLVLFPSKVKAAHTLLAAAAGPTDTLQNSPGPPMQWHISHAICEISNFPLFLEEDYLKKKCINNKLVPNLRKLM